VAKELFPEQSKASSNNFDSRVNSLTSHSAVRGIVIKAMDNAVVGLAGLL
jgi:hypothetical protein